MKVFEKHVAAIGRGRCSHVLPRSPCCLEHYSNDHHLYCRMACGEMIPGLQDTMLGAQPKALPAALLNLSRQRLYSGVATHSS
eukprot:365192-Chlamydomonas_euryale.AAC.3